MQLYRCGSGSGGADYSASYTATVNGVIHKGTCSYKYFNNSTFNSNVTIGNNIFSTNSMFRMCTNFNQNVAIPNGVEYADNMFTACYKLNQNISIGSTVHNLQYTFSACNNLNQNIKIPSNAENCQYMFSGCSKLNQSISLPVINTWMGLGYMFNNCIALNSPITIPSGIISLVGMFYGCSNFNQDLTIPATVTNLRVALSNATNFSKNIYIKGTSDRALDVGSFLRYQNNSKRKNVWFHSSLNSRFNLTSGLTLIGSAITWTAMTNGFYNSVYNIYCYYNFGG